MLDYDSCAPGLFPFSLTESEMHLGRVILRIITPQSRKKISFLSLLINFGEIPVAVCSVVVSDCCAPGPIPDGLTERKRENAFRESHHLSLCNYAEIKVLKYLYSG